MICFYCFVLPILYSPEIISLMVEVVITAWSICHPLYVRMTTLFHTKGASQDHICWFQKRMFSFRVLFLDNYFGQNTWVIQREKPISRTEILVHREKNKNCVCASHHVNQMAKQKCWCLLYVICYCPALFCLMCSSTLQHWERIMFIQTLRYPNNIWQIYIDHTHYNKLNTAFFLEVLSKFVFSILFMLFCHIPTALLLTSFVLAPSNHRSVNFKWINNDDGKWYGLAMFAEKKLETKKIQPNLRYQ